jgi:hypothetical protein
MSDSGAAATPSETSAAVAVAIAPAALQEQAARLGIELDARRAAELAVEVSRLLTGARSASRLAEFEDEPSAFSTALRVSAED